ncbi:MAG: propionyl-CoA synthetase, partial [Congregibacter sp.]|nr:propionyl-CoA synthetase [Congregibacter sp.]
MTEPIDWMHEAQAIHWFKAPTTLLDDSRPPFYRWYPDGVTNACYNALDIHVANGRGEQLALIVDSPVTDHVCSYTYAELLEAVARCAGALVARGVGLG